MFASHFAEMGQFFSPRYSKLKYLTLIIRVKIKAKVTIDGHVWGLEFKRYVPMAIGHFPLKYSKFNSLPWKFKVKVLAIVKTDDHIWSLVFNWHVYHFLRHIANSNHFLWHIANSIIDLENWRSAVNWPKCNQMVVTMSSIIACLTNEN